MRYRDHIALTLPSFLLRLVLAITFLWAGAGKIIGTTTVDGDNAARLANLGVVFIQDSPEDPEATKPDEPLNPLPETEHLETLVPEEQVPEAGDDAGSVDPVDASEQPVVDPPLDPNAGDAPSNPVEIRSVAFVNSPAVGSDYPEAVKIRRLYGIALLLDKSVSPDLTADSQPVTPTMPSWLGAGSMPVYAAWATAITELLAGLFLLFGFLTRISGLSLCVVMLVAMWTTQIGPASLQSSDAILGFIPNAADLWDPSSYSMLLWQLAIVVMSLSVMLLGAGPLSLDRMFFRPNRRDPYVSGEPAKPSVVQKAPKRKPDHDSIPVAERTEFDRSPPPPQNNPTP